MNERIDSTQSLSLEDQIEREHVLAAEYAAERERDLHWDLGGRVNPHYEKARELEAQLGEEPATKESFWPSEESREAAARNLPQVQSALDGTRGLSDIQRRARQERRQS